MSVRSGDTLFWAAYSVTMLVALGLMLGIRAPAKILGRVIVAGLVVCGLAVAIPRLPAESVGNILACTPIALLFLVFFSLVVGGHRR